VTVRAVLFDAGHTLLRAHPSVGEIYAREAESLGARVDAVQLGATFSRVFGENESALAASSIGVPASDAQDAAMWRSIVHKVHARVPELRSVDPEAWYHRLYEVFGRADHWRLYPDVEETLKGLRSRGLTLGIISNWSTRLRSIARETGLESLVDFIVVSSEVGVRKPDPRIFQVALERAGATASEAVYVGDQVEDDVRGAQRVGIRPLLIWRKPGIPAGLDAGWVVSDLAGVTASLFKAGSA